MATSDEGDVFDDIMEFFSDEVVDLGTLQRGVWLGHEARRELGIGTEVLHDRHEAIAKALEYLSKHIAHDAYDRRPASITSEKISSELLKAGLVNILFGCLPDPDTLETSKQDWESALHVKMIYDGFKEFIKYLFIVIGRNEMENFCDDPLLSGLFTIVVGAAASTSRLGPLLLWKDELLRLAWETRGHEPTVKHKPLTIKLLEYLRWEVQGRKDKSCPVDKPWEPVDLETLRRTTQLYQSRLPGSDEERQCANCSTTGANFRCRSCQPGLKDGQAVVTAYCNQACLKADHTNHSVICQETRHLSRLALLFQTTFVQFLLSIHHGTAFFVSEQNGVVKSLLSDQPREGPDLNNKSHFVGISPDLDLSLPKVETALHGFHCCDIKGKARALLEFFFGSFCASIQFMSFIPRNAHTPLEVSSDECVRFNMSAMHTVALLTTRSRRQFILDPTAAQFGWKEYLVPRQTYRRCRIDLYCYTEECKVQDRPGTPIEHTPRPEDQAGREYWTAQVVAEELREITEACLLEKGGLDDVLELPQAQFDKLCSKLKEELESEMRLRCNARI